MTILKIGEYIVPHITSDGYTVEETTTDTHTTTVSGTTHTEVGYKKWVISVSLNNIQHSEYQKLKEALLPDTFITQFYHDGNVKQTYFYLTEPLKRVCAGFISGAPLWNVDFDLEERDSHG